MKINYLNIKKIIEKNWYANDIAKKAFSHKFNADIGNFVDQIQTVDSIRSLNDFRNQMEHIPETIIGSTYSFKRAFGENCLYGYAKSLLEYASIPYSDIFYLPLMEHGIYYINNGDCIDLNRYNKNSAYIFQGRYLEKAWHNCSSKKAYFVGPYIHYASNYYSDLKIGQMKKENGKTLLVFPPHSVETKSIVFNSEPFNKFLLSLAENYSKVLVCVYWADINTPYTHYLERCGFQMVSAGFKLDPLFVSRLKTILSLCDDVVYPSFNSSIGYAYYLKKHIYFAGKADDIKYSVPHGNNFTLQEYSNLDTEFSRFFSSSHDTFESSQSQKLIEKYWGIDEIKSPKQIRRIVLENKKAIRRRLGF